MNLQEILSQRINMQQIKNLTAWASGSRENLNRLWETVHSDDRLEYYPCEEGYCDADDGGYDYAGDPE